YPRCLAGERACPPEDCGGVPGYYQLLEILADPSHDEYAGMVEWLKGHVKKYFPYHADKFDPRRVKFDNPKTRWKNAFGNESR
nr:plasmid pRiA4b ORF-3 family protein [Pseudomonadota bacterium]